MAFNVNKCRLPFGLRNPPSVFQRSINDFLREAVYISYVYVDDIIIYSPMLVNLKTAGM